MKDLGNLEKVELREIWSHEASDFTQWLAQEDNLDILSEELGIGSIKVIQTEANAGDFKIDILAEEEQTRNKIIIENQLEKTNHTHLGQIITYASSQDAKYIIWIAKDIRDEHKQAVDWLNEHTDEDINFFAIQIELWKIGDSKPAPKFNIVSKPNDWTKSIKLSTREGGLREMQIKQLEFWQGLKDYVEEKGSPLKFRTPRPQHWYDLAVRSSEAHISFVVNSKEKIMSCEIYIPYNKQLFKKLEEYEKDIEEAMGTELEWMELPNKLASRIRLSKPYDFEKEDWKIGFSWLKEWGERFYQVFSDYIRKCMAELK